MCKPINLFFVLKYKYLISSGDCKNTWEAGLPDNLLKMQQGNV